MWAVEQKEILKEKYQITAFPFHARGHWLDFCSA